MFLENLYLTMNTNILLCEYEREYTIITCQRKILRFSLNFRFSTVSFQGKKSSHKIFHISTFRKVRWIHVKTFHFHVSVLKKKKLPDRCSDLEQSNFFLLFAEIVEIKLFSTEFSQKFSCKETHNEVCVNFTYNKNRFCDRYVERRKKKKKTQLRLNRYSYVTSKSSTDFIGCYNRSVRRQLTSILWAH